MMFDIVMSNIIWGDAMTSLPGATPLFAQPSITAERRADGATILRSTEPLGEYEPTLAHLLRRRAGKHPERILAAERTADGWRSVTYGEARAVADRLAQAFVDRGLSSDRPLMILSPNSIVHLLMTLAGYTAGVPVAPVSVAYSLRSQDHARLMCIADAVRPGLVFAEDGTAFRKALTVVAGHGARTIVTTGFEPGVDETLDDLFAAEPGDALEKSFAAIGPETVAKVLFTSGSTGFPKGVPNTHRMLCANQQMIRQVWPFLAEDPPVLVDWLPWSHTFGGNHNINLVLANGGTLYIDDGAPAPGLFDRSLDLLGQVAPTLYFNVPAGYAALVPALEADPGFARHFFSRLRLLFTAAAALPSDLHERLAKLAAEHSPDRFIPMTAAWGSTETAPAVTSAHVADAPPGCLGVPLPGTEVKLVPADGKLEMRVRGPNVFSGYLGRPDLTAQAFDEEGFYRIGDAGRPVDPADPNLGIFFDGRIAEDFKLTSGTWVNVSNLRVGLLSACGGLLQDAVIAGHDQAFVSALAWINLAEAGRIAGEMAPAEPHTVPAIRETIGAALSALNAGAGSAARIERVVLLAEPAALDHGEITDKGYINQATVLTRRAATVERLYTEPVAADVILPAADSR
jgi:feruloyl-CoA synthase